MSYGDDMVLGADEADILGAVSRALTRRRRGGGAPLASSANVQPRPGLPASETPADARLRSYVGFGVVSWGAAVTADQTATIEPQESFRGERLVVATSAAGGTPAGITLLRRIDVGTMPQSPSVEQPAPASMFSADATHANLDLQIAHRGTKIAVTLGQSAAPGAGVTVTAAIGMYGEWIR